MKQRPLGYLTLKYPALKYLQYLLLAPLFMPAFAWAHGSLPGMRGFYVGALHPFISVSHLLLIVTLSLLMGFRVRGSRKACMGALAAATFLGLFAGLIAAQVFVENWLSVIVAGLAGGLIVLAWRPPHWVLLAIVSVAGFTLGFESIPDPGRMSHVLVTCLGSFAGINCLVFYGMRGATELRNRWDAHWLQVAVRVVGSWITAVSFLMLAFYLRA